MSFSARLDAGRIHAADTDDIPTRAGRSHPSSELFFKSFLLAISGILIEATTHNLELEKRSRALRPSALNKTHVQQAASPLES